MNVSATTKKNIIFVAAIIFNAKKKYVLQRKK